MAEGTGETSTEETRLEASGCGISEERGDEGAPPSCGAVGVDASD